MQTLFSSESVFRKLPAEWVGFHLSIYPSIHLSIYPYIYIYIYLSIYLSINLSINSLFIKIVFSYTPNKLNNLLFPVVIPFSVRPNLVKGIKGVGSHNGNSLQIEIKFI